MTESGKPYKKPYLIIAGPTATGKTETAVALARMLGGAVISADSMQVYKYMDIGTAKPSLEERQGVTHYLIDELYPDEDYSAYDFQRLASRYAEGIRASGGYPIVCGGTGFYINALIKETRFDEHRADEAFRSFLYALADDKGPEALHEMLKSADPASALAIHPNNIKRVVRALEYHKLTGRPLSEHNAIMRKNPVKNAKIALLTMDRDLLYRRIDRRVDKMMAAGLESEVTSLLERGYGPGLVSMQGLGYKEMIKYLQGGWNLDEAVAAIKTGTRHFAKRQLTWFTRQLEGRWYNVCDYIGPEDLARAMIGDFML
ncbi:MAG: tRNA (adenosine(37)-N6)-dimethylallyltransferase MiaA [Clostridiales bacterium]|jgi:tRNA dimethylallyltransferase|nr:tRNA (adenosine(37)-N6)-dimethylallyltransferase MiaA [Clostridiales bacterium]